MYDMLSEYSDIKSAWKFGSNLYYYCWNTEVFIRDCFLLAHPVYHKVDFNTAVFDIDFHFCITAVLYAEII